MDHEHWHGEKSLQKIRSGPSAGPEGEGKSHPESCCLPNPDTNSWSLHQVQGLSSAGAPDHTSFLDYSKGPPFTSSNTLINYKLTENMSKYTGLGYKIPNSRRKLLNLFLALQASVGKTSQFILFSPMALLQTIPTTLWKNLSTKFNPHHPPAPKINSRCYLVMFLGLSKDLLKQQDWNFMQQFCKKKSTRTLHKGIITSSDVSAGSRVAGSVWSPALLKMEREKNTTSLCNTPACKTLPKTLTSLIKLSH